MTNLQKLTRLLYKSKEVKKDIMELRFGTILYIRHESRGDIQKVIIYDEYPNVFYARRVFGQKDDIKVIPKTKEIFDRLKNTTINNRGPYGGCGGEFGSLYYPATYDYSFEYLYDYDNRDDSYLIGNTLQIHHLQMYCKSICDIAFENNNMFLSYYKDGIEEIETKIDIEYKPFSEWSEETLGKIFNFLIKI